MVTTCRHLYFAATILLHSMFLGHVFCEDIMVHKLSFGQVIVRNDMMGWGHLFVNTKTVWWSLIFVTFLLRFPAGYGCIRNVDLKFWIDCVFNVLDSWPTWKESPFLCLLRSLILGKVDRKRMVLVFWEFLRVGN